MHENDKRNEKKHTQFIWVCSCGNCNVAILLTPLRNELASNSLSEYIQMNLHLRVISHGKANEMNKIILPECSPILARKGTSGRCRMVNCCTCVRILSDIRATCRAWSVPFLTGSPDTTI